jgi:hypothetical protein
VSFALVQVALALLAASVYMLLGRIIRVVKAEHHAIIRIGWLTKIFVFGAVILSQQMEGSYTRGSKIITIVMTVQMIFFDLLLITVPLSYFRTNRGPTKRIRSPEIHWGRHMRVLYAVSVIIPVRCAYPLRRVPSRKRRERRQAQLSHGARVADSRL